MLSGKLEPNDRRKKLQPARIPRERLEMHGVFADIIQDRRGDPSVFFCVVQKQGSPEVLFLGQFLSRSAAKSAAREFMSDYVRRNRTPRGRLPVA